MAAVSCRALYVVRWYEISRVLSVSTTLTSTPNYRNETWCRRWWHISQRSLSLTTNSLAPSLSPILTKEIVNSKITAKHVKTEKQVKTEKLKSGDDASLAAGSAETPAADVTVTYYQGLPRITVPLPSRKEHCMFTLKPITDTVGDFITMLKHEDRGIDRAAMTTIDGVRIASSNTIESLMEADFRLTINDTEYLVSPPRTERHTMEEMEKLSEVQLLVGELYESLHVREHYADMERQVIVELEDVRLQLEPLELKLQEVDVTARRKAHMYVWLSLIFMAVQFGGLARLTWWEYSWDIMEPVTYFVTYGTSIAWFTYFLLTKQEYMLPDVLNRRYLIALHKKAKAVGVDLNTYNALKERAYELEITLKILRGPLYDYKNQMQRRLRARSSSSSSSSRSPSSSPSPSPSPERSVPKREASRVEEVSKRSIPREVKYS